MIYPYCYGSDIDPKRAFLALIFLGSILAGMYWYLSTGHHKVGECFHWADDAQVHRIVKVGQENYFYAPGEWGHKYSTSGFERVNEHGYFMECGL